MFGGQIFERQRIGNLSRVKSLALISDDNKDPLATVATAADVNQLPAIQAIAMHHGVTQSFPKREFNKLLLAADTVRRRDQVHKPVHQRGDQGNLASHPRVHIQGSTSETGFAEHRLPFRTMFAIAAMTGMRVGEILALQTNDLDFERRMIHVRRSVWQGQIQTVKSKASKAPVPMPDALSVMIKAYLESWQPNPAKLLFINRRGRPYSSNKVVQKALWPLLEKLNIPKCGLHAFRHMHSSLLLDTGASPTVTQAQLRHSDARITLGVYGHVIGDSQRNAVEKVANLLAPNGPKSVFSG